MFQNILKILNFTNNNGLLLVSEKDNEISESERKVLYLAQGDYFADAVFFQKNDNHKSVPLFFIYDNTDNEKFKEIKLTEIHKRLWSSEIVPLYFVFEKTEIKIFNAKKRLNIDENGTESIDFTDILEIAKKAEEEFEKKKYIYSSYLFQNGSFWETDYCLKNYLNDRITKESPFEILIKNLHELKEELTNNKISPEIANRIVVFCILIKYLEEKKDEYGYSVFTIKGNIFQNKWNVNNFSDLIKKGEFIELLKYLSEKFNGKIFELTKDEETEIINLSQNNLNHLSNFVKAKYKTKNEQLYLWSLYSFQYLPVELISSIYEEFIPNKDGVVYTPPFMVDFLIDECMPLDKYENFSNDKFKIIDPACGSGIFCVAAYQRLIDWHIINEYKKSGNKKIWNKDLKIETLKKILRENIFGVDLQPQAVQIAVFSLTLAMLEKLTPMQLWHDLDFEDKNDKKDKKFNDLTEKNIKHDDFFNYLRTSEKDFDLVIGNPPFNPDGIGNGENFKYLQEKFELTTSFKIPDDNLALIFLDKSIEILKESGLQCLILPSSAILYNDGAMNYRNHFLRNYHVPQIVDFTHLRRKLFNKDVATCAFFVKKQKPEINSQILHIISHRTANEENKLFFVFDTYDFHFVPYEIATTQKYIWKANLVGGGRLKWIVNRLSRIKPTLVEYIDSKKTEGWSYGEGYILGKKNNTIINGEKLAEEVENWLIKKYKEADWLFEKQNVLKENFGENENFKTIVLKGIKYFQAPRKKNKEIFLSPNLIIHYSCKNKIHFVKNINYKELIFDNMFAGIHFSNENELFDVYDYLHKNNELLSFYSYLTSSKLIVNKEGVIIKSDIDNFPYPQIVDDKIDLQLSKVEQIWQEDVFNYYRHQAKSSKSNPLNDELFTNGVKNIKGEKFISEYANTFIWLMNINYNPVKEKSFKTEKITITKSYIAVEFHYCNENVKTEFEYKKTEEEYQDYFEKTTGNKKISRIVEFIDFANNKIYYIKPHQKRYWLKSIADRDAMSCFADFEDNLI